MQVPSASADPNADAKWCDENLDPGLTVFNPIGSPYDSHTLPVYGNAMRLYPDGRHAVTFGDEYLRKGDYLSIDQTNSWVRLPSTTHFQFFSTAGLAGNLGSDFTRTCDARYGMTAYRPQRGYMRPAARRPIAAQPGVFCRSYCSVSASGRHRVTATIPGSTSSNP
jgi:hypothetical protein